MNSPTPCWELLAAPPWRPVCLSTPSHWSLSGPRCNSPESERKKRFWMNNETPSSKDDNSIWEICLKVKRQLQRSAAGLALEALWPPLEPPDFRCVQTHWGETVGDFIKSVKIFQYISPTIKQVMTKSLLVESDVVVLRLVWSVIRSGLPHRPVSLAEHGRHDLHQLRGVLLVSSLHDTNLSSTSSLPVPDVLRQQDCLQTREERSWRFSVMFSTMKEI